MTGAVQDNEQPGTAEVDSAPDGAEGAEDAERSRRPFWRVVLVLAAVVCFLTLQELDGLLTRMRPAEGVASYSMADLPTLFPPFASDGAELQVVETWRGAPTAGGVVASAADVVGRYVAVDSVFAVLYGALLLVAIAWLKPRVRRVRTDQGEERFRKSVAESTLRIAQAVVVAMVIADLAENALQLWYFAAVGDGMPAVVAVMRFAKAVKFGALVLIVVTFALALRQLRVNGQGTGASIAGTLRVLRVHVLVVLLLFVLVMVPEQAADVIRRWGTDPSTGRASAADAFVLAVVVWATAAWLVASQRRELTGPTRWWNLIGERPADRRLLSGRLTVRIGAAFLAVGAVFMWTGHGIGIMILGAFVTAVGVLSVTLDAFAEQSTVLAQPDAGRSSPSPRGESTVLLPQLLAAAIPAMLGLAGLRALIGEAVYGKAGIVTPLMATSIGFVFGGVAMYVATDRLSRYLEGPARDATDVSARKLTKRQPRTDTAALTRKGRGDPRTFVATAVAAFGFFYAVWRWITVIVDPIAVAQSRGLLALVLAFLLGAGLVMGFVVLVFDHAPPPSAMTAVGFNHVPIVAIIVVWALTVSAFDAGGFHDVRVIPADDADDPVEVADAWAEWLADQQPAARDDERRPALPVVFVSASGGGIRAAYWTALVMDCLFAMEPVGDTDVCPQGEQDNGRSVFVASGVSGSALGLAAYAAHVSTGQPKNDWVDTTLGGDFLSATMARMLYYEVPRTLLGYATGPGATTSDRGDVMEQSWERAWPPTDARSCTGALPVGGPLAQGMQQLLTHDECADLPMLLLSGATVDGCRFHVTPLRTAVGHSVTDDCDDLDDLVTAAPGVLPVVSTGAQDLSAYLCPDTDVRLSTAALLSARFPFVSPSARVEECDGSSHRYVIDGGYIDASGGAAIDDIHDAVAGRIAEFNRTNGDACLAPILVQIDNGYADVAAAPTGRRPNELRVPLIGGQTAYGARSIRARSAAAASFVGAPPGTDDLTIEFDDEISTLDGRVFHIVPRAHPGPQAPLGWVLSDQSRLDLQRQLIAGGNHGAMVKIRRLLNGYGGCSQL